MKKYLVLVVCTSLLMGCVSLVKQEEIDVLVLGSGTGATAAALQAARSGASTALVHPLPWVGGMLTAAGVSATDGNHQMPAGLWGEFRAALYDHYGSPEAIATGWVSNTHFEPKVGAAILDTLLQYTEGLEVYKMAHWTNIQRTSSGWTVQILLPEGEMTLHAKQLIDGTDLGDVAAAVGAGFDLGMDSRSTTHEPIAPQQANDIVQDLTYVAILKDYGAANAPLLEEPPGYSAAQYNCLCAEVCNDPEVIDCDQLLNYARLPNGKYMINWPNNGNDYYLNAALLSPTEREQAYEEAKYETLRFVYFLQQELGYTNLGLADDEFPTEDKLALYPYHREGRRIHGLVQMRLPHIQSPYITERPLFKTGIAVGDYPIDHHHGKNSGAPELDFPAVPSFSVPAGALIARDVPNLLVADKAISVSNIVNGSTRLQPVILQIGQAAGLMAAMASAKNISPAELSVREVQQALLDAGGYLQPYYDVRPDDPDFQTLHRIGACGLLQGTGEPYLWANRTWLYPDSVLYDTALAKGVEQMGWTVRSETNGQAISAEAAMDYLQQLGEQSGKSPKWLEDSAHSLVVALRQNEKQKITRREWAILLDELLQPFQRIPIDFEGN